MDNSHLTENKDSLISRQQQGQKFLSHYQKLLKYRIGILLLFVVMIFISLVLDFVLGPAGLSLETLWNALVSQNSVTANIRTIVWDIRLPYALMAIVVGMALGLAGAEMQTILNNPLASPFTLGLSDAAAFGAALAIVLDISIPGVPGQWIISVNAFLFAVLAALMLDLVTRRSRVSSAGIVLFGIALVFTFKALVSMMQFIATEDTLQGLVFWTMGNLTRSNWVKIGILFAIFCVLFIWSMTNSWKLTALRLGEDRAVSFGIDTKKLRLSTLLRVSLLSATAVAFVGPIGFIGLVAPHIARILFGEDHRFYLPASALVGAIVLSLASIVSKNLLHGVIIPVGIVTALVGVPFFMSIILRYRGRV
ncbi:FecCD family ABC transporter permease [Zophobihabitans entericus]|uniref:Iron ABC transporter permease n=1 Tax=Zophobihabitans entericus TaxID=1635327 RepID=A0A6G9IAB3_9GAMM|nr:iron ABC transporter permease [Zophobihabitans entericus]QIQ21175.1 iron ABC transporter permease [Zophobihabitans entericus]